MAVAVLVYSVINATARYETRAEALNECGDKIKDLIRNLRRELAESSKSGVTVDLTKYNQSYDNVSTDAENHARVDFLFATLEMKEDYRYTGITRLYLYLKGTVLSITPYTIPTLMLLSEILFITDMLSITKIFTPYLAPA
ncbi:hypothetical protein CS8_006520 [Cupriavidus sp. 8B]